MLTSQAVCTGYSGIASGLLSLPQTTVNGTFSLTIIGRLLDDSWSRLSINAAADAAVPEPQTLLLLGIGLLAIAGIRRRATV